MKRFEVSLEDIISDAIAGFIRPDLSSVIEATIEPPCPVAR
jgi:hypothetical protein